MKAKLDKLKKSIKNFNWKRADALTFFHMAIIAFLVSVTVYVVMKVASVIIVYLLWLLFGLSVGLGIYVIIKKIIERW